MKTRILFRIAPLLVAASFLSQPSARAATSAEKGRFVGDGQVLYATPYDPARIRTVTFVSPTVDHPYFEIVVPLGDWTEGASAAVQRVSVNGTDSDSYYVFVDGFSHVQSGWITQGSTTAQNVVLVTRSLWHNNEATTIDVTISATGADGASKSVAKSFSATAPESGGGPTGWKRYQSLVLTENAGLARSNEPVECSIATRKEDCADLERELRLFEYDSKHGRLTPTIFQTFNAKEFVGTPPGTSNPNYLQHPSRSVEVVFPASVPAKSSSIYIFTYDNPDAPLREAPVTDLAVTGPSLGAKVENDHFAVQLDARSGQIASFTLKGREKNPVPTLTNSSSYAVHWNPDSFSDNGLWGHTFAWNPPDETSVTTRGPLLFRVTSRGRMPASTPQVYASVTYSFYAFAPFAKCTTTMEVRDPLNASAIRNGEIVLDSHLVSHLVWKEKTGKIRRMPTQHGPNWQDEWATRVDCDIPWIAMTNESGDYGVGEVVETAISYSPVRGEATTHRAAYYLYYHNFWQTPLTYFTRGWVYPFSDYQRGPIIPVDPGSTYVEKMAFVPFYLHASGGRYQEIDRVSTQMEHPLIQRWGR